MVINESKSIYKWAYIITSFAVLIWLAISMYSFISIEQVVDEKEKYLSTQLTGLLSPGKSAHYGRVETFIESRNHRDQLDELHRDYQNTFLAKTIFSGRADNTLKRTAETLSVYDILYQGLREQNENLNREHLASMEIERDIDRLFNTLSSQIDFDSELSLVQTFLSETDELESRIQNVISELNRREPENLHPEQLQILTQNFYSNYREILTVHLQSVSSLKEEFYTLYEKQKDQHRFLVNFSSQFTQSTGSVQLLYEHLYPLTSNLGEWADPVSSGVQTLERNIIPGMTGLSLLRQIDPVSYQTVVLLGEVADQVVALDSEIEDLAANILSLRQRANRFLNTNSRESAVRLADQASTSARYLDDKRTVFDPIYDRLETAGNQLNRLGRSISGIRNARARNMLSDFNNRSMNMISRMAQPIMVYRENIDQAVRDLNQIVESENSYNNRMQAIQEAEFEAAVLLPPPAVITVSRGLSLDADWMPFFVTIGMGALNLLVVFILLRNPDGVINKKRKVKGAFRDRPVHKKESIKRSPDPKKITAQKESKEGSNTNNRPAKKASHSGPAKAKIQGERYKKDVSPLKNPKKKPVSGKRKNSPIANNNSERKKSDQTTHIKQREASSEFKKTTEPYSSSNNDGTESYKNFSKSVQQAGWKKSQFSAYVNRFPLSFIILNGSREGHVIQDISLSQSGSLYVATLGRSRENRINHIFINDDGRHISRFHAELGLINKKCYVRNLSEVNPLQLNHVEVSGDAYTPIQEKDVLTLGTLQLSAFKP